ncbi:hypothetical protein GGI17_005424 [Coemansia sp. S146]|nr:hypothetical protein GGI17_005424 [Coemansia sp. S146]
MSIADVDKTKLTPEDLVIFEKFEKATVDAKKLPPNVSQDDQLALYGLFKQALVGKNTTARPGMLDFKGKAKYEAWLKNGDMAKQVAQQNYVNLVDTLDKKYAKPTATTAE